MVVDIYNCSGTEFCDVCLSLITVFVYVLSRTASFNICVHTANSAMGLTIQITAWKKEWKLLSWTIKLRLKLLFFACLLFFFFFFLDFTQIVTNTSYATSFGILENTIMLNTSLLKKKYCLNHLACEFENYKFNFFLLVPQENDFKRNIWLHKLMIFLYNIIIHLISQNPQCTPCHFCSVHTIHSYSCTHTIAIYWR